MPVTDLHPEYVAHLPLWTKCRDLAQGEDHIKSPGKRELYIPRLPGMANDDLEYEQYVKRAHYYDATGRTIDGLTGLLERKPPSYNVPGIMEPWLDDVTGNGISLAEFGAQVYRELVTVRRCGVLVDYPQVEKRDRVVAEAEAANIRPFLQLYGPEAITNWRWKRVGGVVELTMVVVHECADADGRDEFSWKDVEQYRVFDLDRAGYYRIRRFRFQKVDDVEGWYQWGPSSYPRRGGQFLREVQFDLYGTPWCRKPWLMGLVNTNLSHLRNSADYERALMIVGNPQPWITGYKPSIEEENDAPGVTRPHLASAGVQREWRLGSGTLWTFVNDQAELGMLVAESQHLSALPEAMKTKREEMVTLGARLLGFDKNVAESAAIEVVRRQGDNSALSSIADEASKGLSKSVVRVRDWLGAGEQETWIEVNEKFWDTPITPDHARAQVELWQAGVIALVDVRQRLRDGDMLDPERSDEAIEKDLDKEEPRDEKEDPALLAKAEAALKAAQQPPPPAPAPAVEAAA